MFLFLTINDPIQPNQSAKMALDRYTSHLCFSYFSATQNGSTAERLVRCEFAFPWVWG